MDEPRTRTGPRRLLGHPRDDDLPLAPEGYGPKGQPGRQIRAYRPEDVSRLVRPSRAQEAGGLMPRPPLPIGTYGYDPPLSSYPAGASARSPDSGIRTASRGRSRPHRHRPRRPPRTSLREHLRERTQSKGPRDGPERRFPAPGLPRVVDDPGRRQLVHHRPALSQHSAALQAPPLDTHVLPALGALRLREVTVPRLDHAVQTIASSTKEHRDGQGSPGRFCPALLGLAVRYGAIPEVTQPATSAGSVGPALPAAATCADRRGADSVGGGLLGRPRAARRKDLPDLCEWMLATGVRIGEALAVNVGRRGSVHAPPGRHRPHRHPAEGRWAGPQVHQDGVPGTDPAPFRLFAVTMLRRRKPGRRRTGAGLPGCAGRLAGSPRTRRGTYEMARGSDEFAWVTSHVFRKSAATSMERAGLTARDIADQLGHARVSMTQDVYLGRRAVSSSAAEALERAHHDDGEEKVSGP